MKISYSKLTQIVPGVSRNLVTAHDTVNTTRLQQVQNIHTHDVATETAITLQQIQIKLSKETLLRRIPNLWAFIIQFFIRVLVPYI
jgi:hypothetical protein